MPDVRSSQSRLRCDRKNRTLKPLDYKLSDISGSHTHIIMWRTPWNSLGKYLAGTIKEQKKENRRVHVDRVKVKLALAPWTSFFAFIKWPTFISFFLSLAYCRAEMSISRRFFNFVSSRNISLIFWQGFYAKDYLKLVRIIHEKVFWKSFERKEKCDGILCCKNNL